MKIPAVPLPTADLVVALDADGFDLRLRVDIEVGQSIQCRKLGRDPQGRKTHHANEAAAKLNLFLAVCAKMVISMWPNSTLAAIHAILAILGHPNTREALLSFTSRRDACLVDIDWALGSFVATLSLDREEKDVGSLLGPIVSLSIHRVISYCQSPLQQLPFGTRYQGRDSFRDRLLRLVLVSPQSANEPCYFKSPPSDTTFSTEHPGFIIATRTYAQETPTSLPPLHDYQQTRVIGVLRSGCHPIPSPLLKGGQNHDVEICMERDSVYIVAAYGDRLVNYIASEVARQRIDNRDDPTAGPSMTDYLDVGKSNITFATIRDVMESYSEDVLEHFSATEFECLAVLIYVLNGPLALARFLVPIFELIFEVMDDGYREYWAKHKSFLVRKSAKQHLKSETGKSQQGRHIAPLPQRPTSRAPLTPVAINSPRVYN